jgi:hypothetical protein
LLIDGNGAELLIEASFFTSGAYVSPAGDFSMMKRLGDGTFQRTMKDQTVYSFNAHNDVAVRAIPGSAVSGSYHRSSPTADYKARAGTIRAVLKLLIFVQSRRNGP